eukprot:1036653-Amorphochlora_amoeboformis.AAC.1
MISDGIRLESKGTVSRRSCKHALLAASPDRLYELGRAYYNGFEHFRTDMKKGKTLIMKARERGSVVAEGKCCYEGWGVKKDLKKAVMLYQK